MLGTDVVTDALRTIILAIKDLIKYDRNIDLAFGFCNVRFLNKKLNTVFRDDLSRQIAHPTFED